jgi:hypothetical protein
LLQLQTPSGFSSGSQSTGLLDVSAFTAGGINGKFKMMSGTRPFTEVLALRSPNPKLEFVRQDIQDKCGKESVLRLDVGRKPGNVRVPTPVSA